MSQAVVQCRMRVPDVMDVGNAVYTHTATVLGVVKANRVIQHRQLKLHALESRAHLSGKNPASPYSSPESALPAVAPPGPDPISANLRSRPSSSISMAKECTAVAGQHVMELRQMVRLSRVALAYRT